MPELQLFIVPETYVPILVQTSFGEDKVAFIDDDGEDRDIRKSVAKSILRDPDSFSLEPVNSKEAATQKNSKLPVMKVTLVGQSSIRCNLNTDSQKIIMITLLKLRTVADLKLAVSRRIKVHPFFINLYSQGAVLNSHETVSQIENKKVEVQLARHRFSLIVYISLTSPRRLRQKGELIIEDSTVTTVQCVIDYIAIQTKADAYDLRAIRSGICLREDLTIEGSNIKMQDVIAIVECQQTHKIPPSVFIVGQGHPSGTVTTNLTTVQNHVISSE